jgi:hypothetical protein
MPPRRTLLIAAVATPFALLLALFALLRFGAFDAVVARALSRTLATPVAFDGLSFGLLGRPHVVVTGLRIGPAGADGRLVDGVTVDAVLPWATLRGGPPRVDALRLAGGTVVLSVDASGRASWTALVARVIELAGPGPAAFAVDRLDVEDLKLRYVDHAAGVNLRVAGLTLGAAGIVPARSFPVELRLAVSVDPWSAHGRLAGRARLDPDRGRHEFELDRFLVWVGGGALPLGGIEASGRLAGVDYDAAADRAVFRGVQGRFAGVAFEAAGHVERVATAPDATVALRFAPFAPRAFAQALGFDLPATRDPRRLGRAEFRATLAVSAARIAASGLAGTLDDTRFEGTAALPLAPRGTPTLQLHLDRLALDGYLPAAAASGSGGPVKPAPRDGGLALEELLRRLRALDLDATVRIDDARAFDTRWRLLAIRIEPNKADGTAAP